MKKGALVTAILACLVAGWYLRYIDWPPTDGTAELEAIFGSEPALSDVYVYRYRSFMDTWILFRFSASTAAIEQMTSDPLWSARGRVTYFPLIVARPPPYWWHPQRLAEADLYEGIDADARAYTLMYSSEEQIAYFFYY